MNNNLERVERLKLMDKEQIGMCGAYCGYCEWKERKNCPGCQTCKGKMFYGECGVAKCCLGKGFLHCDKSLILFLKSHPCFYY